jgi:hypothetical protein
VKIGGMGYAILRVTAEQLRELHTIPADVVFERTIASMPSAFKNDLTRDWCYDAHPFYFRIQHRYLPRTTDRGPLTVFTLHELLRQIADVKMSELENSGKPVPPHLYGGSWIED